MNKLKGWLNLFWEYGNSGIKPKYMPKQKYTDGERVEVCMNDDRRWRQATFRQKTVEVYYWTQEPGEEPCGWDRIRKIDPDKK